VKPAGDPSGDDRALLEPARVPSYGTVRRVEPRRPAGPRKAAHAGECKRLEQLPNIGASIARDLRQIGIVEPGDLAGRDALDLYRALGEALGRRQDPCVLDTFMAAVDFMNGAPPRPWWTYTAERKRRHGVT
jgi:hypothetical protein